MFSQWNENAPGENGFSFFQVKIFIGSVRVLLTSASLKKLSSNIVLQSQFSQGELSVVGKVKNLLFLK